MEKFAPHVERLKTVAVSLSRRFVALAGERHVDAALVAPPSRVHIVAHADGVAHASYDAGTDVGALAFLADDLLVAGAASGELIAWDVGAADEQPRVRLGAHEGGINAIAADTTGTTLASVGDDGVLRIAPLVVSGGGVNLDAVAQRKLSSRPLRAVAIDASASLVAVAGDDGVVRTLPVASAERGEIREMRCGEGGITALAFTGDGRIAAGCGDGSVRLCYLEGAVDEENRSGDAAHTGAVRGLVFGPELHDEADRLLPRRLFSVGADGLLRAWQLDSRRKPRTVELGAGEPTAMVHVGSAEGAKADRRGGQLVVVFRDRHIVRVTVNEKSEPSENVERMQSALEQLAQALGAKKDDVRVAAINSLAELPEDEARLLLERALAGDRQAEVRKLAAERIGAGVRRLSRPALRTALDDKDDSVRTAALAALTAIEASTPLSPVRAALRSRHADMRVHAIGRLPELRDASPLVPGLVADALNDGESVVRAAALDALFALSPEGSLEPARVALGRGPADMRSATLLRIARAGQAGTAEGSALLEEALDDGEPSVRSTAFLVAVATRDKLAAAVRTVDAHTAAALSNLDKEGQLGSDQEVAPLTDEDLHPLFAAMACRNADTALRGARLLALIGDSRATGALLGLSREADVEVRRYVVEGLGVAATAMPGDDRVTSRLEWLLDDEDATVREWSFDTLLGFAESGGAAAKLDFVAMALRCAHEDIRARTLQTLVALGGPEAADEDSGARADRLLGDALDDEAAKVRGEAFRTLWAWHGKTPRVPLERGVGSRHGDIRKKVVEELTRIDESWARDLILQLVGDGSAEVGLAAYQALTKTLDDKKQSAVHLAAMVSPRPEIRAEGCKGAHHATPGDVHDRLVELVEDEHPIVHLAAIAAVDALVPEDRVAFEVAFASIFYELRVAAAAHCARRRDTRGVEPMKELLTIPKTHMNRPSDDLRQRAARALAAVGDVDSVRFYVSMLDDEDGVVQEMGARGLASACRPGEEQPLLDGMSHENLAVRSWVAEGLARLGDDRAVPVLAGTLRHEHRPIRLGAILSFVALGPDGVRGILQGLEDQDRAIQDLVLAVVVARDVALARADLPPDLLLSALCAASPEIRFAAARAVEARSAGEQLSDVATELVGPHKPDRAADMKEWPQEEERQALLNVTVNSLASDRPSLRYAAANVLWLRAQPLSFWREARRLSTLTPASEQASPHTDWSDEPRQPRQRGWIRRLFTRPVVPQGGADSDKVLTLVERVGGSGASGDEIGSDELARLAFGTFAGLVRQAPAIGESDETHRVRRDATGRLAALGELGAIGRDAVLPVFRRALSDPHHLVRKAAVTGLRSLYPGGALEPLALALASSAADVGRAAVDELIEAALAGNAEASALAKTGVNAPEASVRSFALGRLPRLFEAGSLEPWLLALASNYADVRSSVVDRLVDSNDERVAGALSRAMESDHEDLRLKAAVALARRGERQTVDVLAGLLRSEDGGVVKQATEALIALPFARAKDPGSEAAATAAAEAVAGRLEDDPDQTANKPALIRALARIGNAAGDTPLLTLLGDEDGSLRSRAFSALTDIARLRDVSAQVLPDGGQRQRYDEPLALRYVSAALESGDEDLKAAVIGILRDIDDDAAEGVLERLVDDRSETARVAACEALAFRSAHVDSATVEPLSTVLRAARRELVLPAAVGLAAQGRPEAFQSLMLVFKAGEPNERERALLALGGLGDRRALEELEPLVDPATEIEEGDRFLVPVAAEALGSMLPRLDGEELGRVRETVNRLAREGDGNSRTRALAGLAHAGDEQSRGVLENIAGDRHDGMRRVAIVHLGALAHPDSEAVLAEALLADDRQVRRTALEAVRKLFPEDETRASLLALCSPHADVAAPAATFLARHGDAATLVARLADVEDAGVRRRLRQGLVRRGECPVDSLAALLRGERAGARAEAAWMAGAAGDEQLAGAVAEGAVIAAQQWHGTSERAGAGHSADREQAWRATLWAARRLRADAGAPAREAAGNIDAPVAVRRAALSFLTVCGEAADLDVIRPCLLDPSATVRAAAAEALAVLAPEAAATTLAELPVADVAAMVPVVEAALPTEGAELLRAEGSRQLVLPVVLGRKRLTELVAIAEGAGKDAARLVATASLGRVGGDEAAAALEKILANEEEEDEVRATAFKALRRLQRNAEKANRYREDA